MAERYTTHDKVNRLLRLQNVWTSSSVPNIEQVENLIEEKMAEIDKELRNSWHLSQRQNEHHEIVTFYQAYTGVRIALDREYILDPVSGTDKIEIWDGNAWTDWVATKTFSRSGDYWLNNNTGELYLRTFAYRYPVSVRVTYRHNSGGRATEGVAVNSTDLTLTVDSTNNFPQQGWLRIDDEEVRYNNKTTTTFTLVERGAFNSTAASHSIGAIVFWCPKDIEELCTKMVAVDLLTTEDWSTGGSISGEMPSGQAPIMSKIEIWKKDIEGLMDRYRKFLLIER